MSISKQIERTIIEGNCIEEIIKRDNLIKRLDALNLSSNELEIILDVLKKLNEESRLELRERLVRFSETANNLNIKLIKQLKELNFNFLILAMKKILK